MIRKKYHIIRRTKKLQDYCANRKCYECLFALQYIDGFRVCRITDVPEKWDLSTPFQHISTPDKLILTHAQLIKEYCKRHRGLKTCLYCKFYDDELLGCTFDDVHEYCRQRTCEASQWNVSSIISNKEEF